MHTIAAFVGDVATVEMLKTVWRYPRPQGFYLGKHRPMSEALSL